MDIAWGTEEQPRFVLQGALRDIALDTAAGIADALSADENREAIAARGPFLAEGTAGIAMALEFAGRVLNVSRYSAHAAELRDSAMLAIEEHASSPGLFTGYCGVAWVLAVHELAMDTHFAECTASVYGLEEIDELVGQLVRHGVDQLPDLILGTVGMGLYAVARASSASGSALLSTVAEWVAESARQTIDGVRWDYALERLPGAGDIIPSGGYPLGMAHGHAGIIALLARLYDLGVERARVRPLLEGAVRYLLSQRHIDDRNGMFPPVAVQQGPAEPSNVSWCWGDPGIACALAAAARSCADAEWQNTANRAILMWSSRNVVTRPLFDASLCHGAAGIATILARFYSVSGSAEFADEATTWFRRMIELRQPGAGYGGYLFRKAKTTRDGTLEANPGFLAGSAGVAVACLSAATGTYEPWARAMAIDV